MLANIFIFKISFCFTELGEGAIAPLAPPLNPPASRGALGVTLRRGSPPGRRGAQFEKQTASWLLAVFRPTPTDSSCSPDTISSNGHCGSVCE